MSCFAEVKQAIIDKVYSEFVDKTVTFSRQSGDFIKINAAQDTRLSKATSRNQAVAMAKTLQARIKESFNGHVVAALVNEEGQAVKLKILVSDKYINHEVSKVENINRDYVNDNTGPNTHGQLALFFPTVGTQVGVFEKYVQFREGILMQLEQKLSRIERQEKVKSISAPELTRLKNLKREIKLLIDGSYELGKKGIKQELAELRVTSDFDAIGPYVEKDLKRLEALSKSTDLDDLREADKIVQFYSLVGTFTWDKRDDNPFFTKEEIFLEDQNGELVPQFKISDAAKLKCESWANKAISYDVVIQKRKEEVTVNQVNTNPSVIKTYGNRQFTFDEITNKNKGLGDTDYVSMWTMDITSGIFSHNGMIPQVMFSTLVNSAEMELAWAREIEERVNAINPQVQRELMDMGYTLRAAGIVGLGGATYQIFKEITREGNETGGLVRRYIKEFFDAQNESVSNFWNEFNQARYTSALSNVTKAAAFNKAFEKIKQWRRANTIIVDVKNISEILSDAEFAPMFAGQSTNVNPQHKQDLIDVLGQKGYDEEIGNQKRLLRKYNSEKQSILDTALTLEGVATFADLPPKVQDELQTWENNHNPFVGIEDYENVSGVFVQNRKVNSFMDYNTFIPRKYSATVAINATTGKYEYTNTTTESGNYDKSFDKIEKNSTLSTFYDIIKEVVDKSREAMPIELQQKMAVNHIPSLMKTSAEIIGDKSNGVLSSLVTAFKHMFERIRVGFGVKEQSDMSFANIDPVTQKANYKVNDTFFRDNADAVNNMIYIEKVKFLQAINSTKPKAQAINTIKRYTVLPLNSLGESGLIMLAKYLHVDISLADIQAGRLDTIRNITSDKVQIGKYIRDFSLHSVVQSQSFDLGKISKYFSNLVAMYSAREKALPILEIMKKHYENIKTPETNNVSKQLLHIPTGKALKSGLRTNGIKQNEDWFGRVAIDNYGLKHKGIFGQKNLPDGTIPLLGEKIYTIEERKRFEEITELIKNETDDAKIIKLREMQDKLGVTRTATAFVDNIYAWIRTMRLGYNLSSATTNLMEGITSNLILAENGDYFDAKELFYGYAVVKHSFLKNISFGKFETGLAKKNRNLMDKFRVLMDSKNELQKSSTKTYSSKFSWANPLEINQRIEYMNQSPLMIASLRTIKIKDINGSEGSVWDAMDASGHLLPDFKTPENIENWEKLSGEQYLNFKQKLHKIIVLGHGNYDELRGMLAKSSTTGKGLMMFKTWLPMQLYWRFAVEQDDIQLGTQGFKGRYYSYTPTTGIAHGAVIGGAVGGVVGLAVGAVIGGIVGARGTRSNDSISVLQETVEVTKQLFKKSLGMPVNMIYNLIPFTKGRQIMDTGKDGFNKFIGPRFTEQDARNMRGNMADISLQLAWIAMMLLVKSVFWDDEEDKDEEYLIISDRALHNIAINKLMQLSTQATMYVNPVDMWDNTIGSNAAIRYLEDLKKELVAIDKLFNGDDIIASGRTAGQSRLWNQTTKTFMPGMFKDQMFGFAAQADRVFDETRWHKLFQSEKGKDEKINKGERAAERKELQDQYELDMFEGETKEEQRKNKKKYIEKQVNEDLPTRKRLEKLGMTREEYEAQQNPE